MYIPLQQFASPGLPAASPVAAEPASFSETVIQVLVVLIVAFVDDGDCRKQSRTLNLCIVFVCGDNQPDPCALELSEVYIRDWCDIIILWRYSNINQNLDIIKAQASTRVPTQEIFTRPIRIILRIHGDLQ